MQAGWNSNYNTFVAWANPTSFRNVNEVSESGDTVTFTFDLHNGTYGTSVSYTATFTVDNGIITSSTSYDELTVMPSGALRRAIQTESSQQGGKARQ